MQRDSIYRRYVPSIQAPESMRDDALCFAFSEGKLLLEMRGQSGVVPSVADLTDAMVRPLRTQYLGTLEGKDCYSMEVGSGPHVASPMAPVELRASYGLVDEDIYLLAGKAQQIVAWDQTSQFCGRCGRTVDVVKGERAKKCPSCGMVTYPRLSPAAITAVVKDDQILLAKRVGARVSMFSILAGFVEPGETLEECIHREVFEEVAVRVKNVKYVSSQPWPFPNSLMIGFTAEYAGGEVRADGVELAEAGWFDAKNLPEVPPKMTIARELIDWFAAGGYKSDR